MSKTNNQEEVIVDVEELYSKTESWVESNKQTLIIAVVVMVVVVGGYFYYTNSVLAPLQEEAQLELYKAQNYFEQDSFQLAMYGDAAGNLGFADIAAEYSSTNAGNIANYYMGVSLLRTGDYEGAIEFLSSYSGSDPVIAPLAVGNIGDAYAELNDFDQAESYYAKAAKSAQNELISPRFLSKAGAMAEANGNFKAALSYYEELSTKYGASQEGRVAEKHIAKVKAKI